MAAELEGRWNRALEVVAEVERERVAIEAGECRKDESIDRTALLELAEDLPRVWHDPVSDLRLKKRIVRTLIEEILVDLDEESARIHMVVRWAGGQHARLSVRKKRKGQHRYTTDRKVVEIVRELAAMLPDGQIARVLNRLGLKTGRNNSWTAGRVNSLRHYRGIPVYDPETCKREGLLTLKEAAALLNVSPSVVGRMAPAAVVPPPSTPASTRRGLPGLPASSDRPVGPLCALSLTGTSRGLSRDPDIRGQRPAFNLECRVGLGLRRPGAGPPASTGDGKVRGLRQGPLPLEPVRHTLLQRAVDPSVRHAVEPKQGSAR